jgi:hypothetical protein
MWPWCITNNSVLIILFPDEGIEGLQNIGFMLEIVAADYFRRFSCNSTTQGSPLLR